MDLLPYTLLLTRRTFLAHMLILGMLGLLLVHGAHLAAALFIDRLPS